ncbi:MAG: glutamyl-tRNA reductase [Deltaproteobacteria bacterium]|nr:glutamyl-tRNA reductase [Deltaproteobacteria bacterium]
MARDLCIVGVNHRTAPVALRERLAFPADGIATALGELKAVPGVQEAAIVSTCNRVEVVTGTSVPAAMVAAQVEAYLTRVREVERSAFAPHLYVHHGRDAIRHLFRVAASLDSMVVGEPQILGQMKDQYVAAAAAGTSGPVLHKAFHRAFTVAKRVRTETGIASKSVSVASVAADLTRTIFETLEDKTVMLVGAGKMSQLVARHLQARGTGDIMVTTRTFDHAAALAHAFGGLAIPFERLAEYLKHADIVIGSAGAADHLVGPQLVQEVLRARKQRPMFFIDLAVPRNFDPAINDLDNVYVYDMDDLARTSADHTGEREREALRAEAIVEDEVERFVRWLAGLDVVPTIVALREKLETIRRAELEKALTALQDAAPRHRALLDALTSSIVNKILHTPLASLKREGAPDDPDLAASVRRLFDLEIPAARLTDDPEEEK